MKRVYVLRHGEWKSPEDKLTKVGKQKALELKEHLPDFEFVYSSDFGRTKDTAEILSNKTPKIDNRAGVLDASRDQLDMIKNLRESHPLGVAGAIFEIE